jgi:hypothetical protein
MGRLTPAGVCPVPKTALALSDGGNALTAYSRRTRTTLPELIQLALVHAAASGR